MKKIISLLVAVLVMNCTAQTNLKFNLGFEKRTDENALADGWFKWGASSLSIDSVSHSGYQAALITSLDENAFGAIAYKIPAKYTGKTIRLEAYMKIQDVEGGNAGLLLRVDGDGAPLVFANMKSENISGTRPWQKYAIQLAYPEGANSIYIAGYMSGKGEAWFDDFVLYIDGKDVQNLTEVEQPKSKAELDTAFDKGSTCKMVDVDAETVDALVLLAKVWGFLKYHHPEIAKGNYNWDYELFRLLPKYIKASNNTEREALLLQWISDLGEVEECKDCDTADKQAFIKPNINWIHNSIESQALVDMLHFVYNNRNRGEHFYIKKAKGVGNPIFTHENAYANMPYPDAGFRLLALYRYWNMINYFYPNKYLLDKDWNTVLKQYVPLFLQAKNELEYEQVAIQLIGDIQDTHANLWGGNNEIEANRGTFFAPVHLKFVEGQLVVADYYNAELKIVTGLEIGDVITKIEGEKTSDIVLRLSKYYPASNQAARLRDMAANMLRSQNKALTIEYLRDGKLKTKRVDLYDRKALNMYHWYKQTNEQSYRLLDDNIGYVTLMSIKDDDVPKIKEAFKNTKGIIIDIRNYPSAFVPFSLGSYFVSSSTPFVKFTECNLNNPGEFNFTEMLRISPSGDKYAGKLVVLLNELSQSQAEYTAMAFKAGDNTTIIGSTTAGADGNVSSIMLPGGLRTMISGIGIYYPNGGETQRVGIVPDIEVKPTIKGIQQAKDELIDKAIEIILHD